ncbi:MAG TPA: serine hydrolase domain-containing protein [Pyrinomonadaceae bacterium]|nr:serine hydrolase domain-containing protein [Pyrinomonadaceae bacterium]
MTTRITRRSLLKTTVKAGAGLFVLNRLNVQGAPFLLIKKENQTDRYSAVYKRLDEFITRHMAEVNAPGMTVAIADRQGILRTMQYGFADLKTGARVTPNTLFEIGSISKSFVAIAIVQLADEGKLDLNKPVKDYLPWLKIESSHAPFTTHHLLSHTSGLSTVPLLLRVTGQTLRTGPEPGSEFAYCNLGYDLLGLLLETIDKRPFAEALRQRVLRPLGMSASEPVINDAARERIAVGYRPLYDDRPFPVKGKLAEAPWIEVPEAAGSVASTADDMCKYLSMLLNHGDASRNSVLSRKAFNLFTKPVIKAPFRGEDASYAYGLWTSDTKGHTLLRHTGGMVAFSSAMYADLTDGFGVFASVNARLAGGYRPVAVARYALDLLSAAAAGKELPALPPPAPAPDHVLNAQQFAGTYVNAEGQKLVFSSDGPRVMLQYNGSQLVLEGAGRDRFIVPHPDFELFTLNFGRDSKNVIVEVFHGSNWWTNQSYIGPKVFGYNTDWEAFTGHFRSDSPWYGSSRVIIRKGKLLLDDQALIGITAGVFQPEGGTAADRVVFDTMISGKASRMNYSGIDFFRTFTA